MDKDVYFFDDSQKLIKIVGEDRLFSVVQEKEITPSKDELINDKLAVSMEFDLSLIHICIVEKIQ